MTAEKRSELQLEGKSCFYQKFIFSPCCSKCQFENKYLTLLGIKIGINFWHLQLLIMTINEEIIKVFQLNLGTN